ncbi:MAG: FIG00525068: membrane protein, partial [uncultured Frankineae bacterium]
EHCRARQGACDLHAARGQVPRDAGERGVPGPAQALPRVGHPRDHRGARLVLRLRGPRRVRPRLHGPEADRQHQRRAGPRAAAVRVDLRRDRRLHPARRQGPRPGVVPPARPLRRRRPV